MSIIPPTRPGLDQLDASLTKAKVRRALLGRDSTPTKIGRFEIVGRAGSGAMGRVLIGVDPDLGRKVALKLIPVEATDDEAAERLRARLLREARALASLSHPNVVTAYEVGAVAGDVYVAMEYVPGRTLREWIGDAPPWSDVADVFAQAATGLAAAHADGFVHRDFKPDNVIVGEDRRVRVVDFGLARGPDPADIPPTERSDSDAAPEPALQTRTGAQVGTPAYLAPEVRAGGVADAKSDQYSFCVSLHEALRGTRPDGTGGAPVRADAPPWLSRIAARGLSVDPAQRFEDMTAVVTALRRDPTRRRRTLVLLGLVACAGAFVALASVAAFAGSPCDDVSDEIAEVWGTPARDRLAQRFAEEEAEYVAQVHERAVADLDRFASAWTQQRVDACEAARVREEDAPDARLARLSCLDVARSEFESTIDAIAEGATLERATEITGELPDVARCADIVSLQAVRLPPEGDRQAVAEIRDQLAKARVKQRAGEALPARELASKSLAQAEPLGYAPLVAEAKNLLGITEAVLDDPHALETLREAVWHAEAERMDDLAADTWLLLAHHSIDLQRETSEVHRHLERASAAVARLRDPGRLRQRLHTVEGWLAVREARFEDAHAALEKAVALAPENNRGRRLSSALAALATSQFEAGKIADARATMSRAVALAERASGPRHPHAGLMRADLGTILVADRDYEPGAAQLRDSIEILAAAYGPDSLKLRRVYVSLAAAQEGLGQLPDAIDNVERSLRILDAQPKISQRDRIAALINLGRLQRRMKQYTEARAHLAEALSVAEASYGRDHPRVAEPLTSLGALAFELGEHDEAARHHARALQLRRAKLGDDVLIVGVTHHNLTDCYVELERWADAVEQSDAALRVFEAHLDAKHPYRQQALVVRARALAGVRRWSDGLTTAQDALSIIADDNPGLRASALFELARARRATGQADAEPPARDALALIEGRPNSERLRARIEAWLS